jgi:hypothetical protein
MKADGLFLVFVVITLGCVYVFWVRPILKRTPRFADFYANEASIFTALRLKFQGVKERLIAVFVTVASVLISMHDFIAPYITGDTVEQFTKAIPPWAIPLIPMAVSLLMLWLRSLAEKRVNETGEVTAEVLPSGGR